MAVANTKSTYITNADASPVTPSSGLLAGGAVLHQKATLEVAAADDNNSVYRFFRLHTSWTLLQLLLWNDAIASGTDFDIGAHDTAANGGAVILVNAWGDAVSMASARVAPLDITFEQLNVDKIEKKIWEQLGLSTDPRKYVDITATGVTVGTAAGTLSMLCYYSMG